MCRQWLFSHDRGWFLLHNFGRTRTCCRKNRGTDKQTKLRHIKLILSFCSNVRKSKRQFAMLQTIRFVQLTYKNYHIKVFSKRMCVQRNHRKYSILPP